MVRLALARMILKFSMFVEVGDVLTFLSAFRKSFKKMKLETDEKYHTTHVENAKRYQKMRLQADDMS